MIGPLDDESTPKLRRRCAKRRCPNDARASGSPRGALCVTHHAAAMHLWRKRRRAAGKPVAGATRTAPSSATEATRERKQLSRARRRGDIIPQPCAACRANIGVVATHLDASEPHRIVWACRGCRSLLVRGLAERQHDQAREADLRREHAAFAELCGTVDGLVAGLPPEVAAALHDVAARSGPLRKNRPGQPIYTQMLAFAYRRWVERGG